MTVCWDIDPSASLADITEWCLVHGGVDRLLVTARESLDHRRTPDEPRVDTTVEELFGASLLETFWAHAWPGTQLFEGGASKIYVAAFDEAVRTRMIAMEDSLPQWTQWHEPPLPADVCLYKLGDPLPALVSMTHQQEPWFEAWLFDDTANGASFVTKADPPLPADLIPPPPSFVRRASLRTNPRRRSTRRSPS